MEQFLKDIISHVWEWLLALAAVISGLIGYIYITDRDRVKKLEDRMLNIESGNITRQEFDRTVEEIKKDYKEEHSSIFAAISECNRILREDIATNRRENREDLKAIRDEIMSVIERRGTSRKVQ